MVELGFMSQKYYDNYCAYLTGGIYRCVDAALIYFMRFCEYAVSTKGFGLTQIKIDLCLFLRKSEKGKPE